jgi:hypothetical protein
MEPDALRKALLSRSALRAASVTACMSAAGLLGACANINEAAPLEVRDDGATAVSLRSVLRIDPRRGHGVEFDFAQQRGRDTGSLGAGERLQFGSAAIDGPESLHSEATVRSFHVAYNYLIPASGPLDAEVFAGIGRMDLKLHVQGSVPGALIERTLGGSVLVAGIGPRLRLSEQFALEGRLSVATAFGTFRSHEKDSVDVALAYRPASRISVRAGYAWVKATVDRNGADSNVSVRLRGPYFGLSLNF